MRATRACLLLTAVAVVAACGGGVTPAAIPSADPAASPPRLGEADPARTIPRPAALADLPLVQLVAPDEVEAGRAPTFEWSPVGAADAYRLSVLGPDGPMWAWQGEATSIRYGGVPDGTNGPSLVPGSWWSVAALAADGSVVALSELRTVSPASDRAPAPAWADGHASPAASASPSSSTPPAGQAAVVGWCDMLTPVEIADAIGGDWLEPTEGRLDARNGWCDWTSARGTLLTLTISPAAHFDPAGWDADEPIAGVGDEAYWAAVGWDRRVVFVQGESSLMLAIDFSRVDRDGLLHLAGLVAGRLPAP
jgi:hypothetical protein